MIPLPPSAGKVVPVVVVGIIVLGWALVMTCVVAMCRASGRADADGERLRGMGLDAGPQAAPGERTPAPATAPSRRRFDPSRRSRPGDRVLSR